MQQLQFLLAITLVLSSASCREESQIITEDDTNEHDDFFLAENDAVEISPSPQKLPIIEILNVVSGGKIHSNKIVGRCKDSFNIESVEVKIDDKPYAKAEGGVFWSFTLETGASSWRKGSVHTIHARCITTDHQTSLVASLLIRQGDRHDFNGDGFPDIVSSSPLASPPQDYLHATQASGLLHVFYGNTKGINPLSRFSSDSDLTIYETAAHRKLGNTIAFGDFNADGYADIAASEPGYLRGKGKVAIIYGKDGMHGSINLDELSQQIIIGHSLTGSLGITLGSSDLNLDGYDDLIIAQSSSPGRVLIFYGGKDGFARGLEKISTRDASLALIGKETSFGSQVVVEDFDRDGFNDLAISEPGLTFGGRVMIYHGGSSGFNIVPRYQLSYQKKDFIFGESLTMGDFNGDLIVDAAIGLSTRSKDKGAMVAVIPGHVITKTNEVSISDEIDQDSIILLKGKPSHQFGQHLAVSDIDRNGSMDLLVGSPGYDLGRGRMYIFDGNEKFFQQKLSTKRRIKLHLTGNSEKENLGRYFTSNLDLNSDGQDDLLIACPSYSYEAGIDRGRIYAILPRSLSFSADAMIEVLSDNIIEGSHSGGGFGWTIP